MNDEEHLLKEEQKLLQKLIESESKEQQEVLVRIIRRLNKELETLDT